jgi:hypothetical protein
MKPDERASINEDCRFCWRAKSVGYEAAPPSNNQNPKNNLKKMNLLACSRYQRADAK